MNEDLPPDLGKAKDSMRIAGVAGMTIGGALLVLDLAMLWYATTVLPW